MSTSSQLLWAAQAWVGERWQHGVLLAVDSQGRFGSVQAGVPAPEGATVDAEPAATDPGPARAPSVGQAQ